MSAALVRPLAAAALRPAAAVWTARLPLRVATQPQLGTAPAFRGLASWSSPPLVPVSAPLSLHPAGVAKKSFSTHNIRGRLFYKRRPKMVPRWRFNRFSKWLEGVGCKKGVCTKVYVTSPKKPNSGLRKVAYVRLSNGRIVKTYIPGIGHNLQVHSVVMVRGGRRRDVVGCHYTCMRGAYDLLPVKNRKTSRSKYGVKRDTTRKTEYQRYKWLTTDVDRRLHFYKTGEELDSKQDKEPPLTNAAGESMRIVRNNPEPIYRKPRGAKKK